MKVTENVNNAGWGGPRVSVDIEVKGHRSSDLQQVATALAEHTKDGLEEVHEVLEDG